MENQGLHSRHLHSFSLLACPRDFFLCAKKAFWLEAKPTSCQAMCHYKNLTAKGKTVRENSLAITIVWYRLKVPGFHWHTPSKRFLGQSRSPPSDMG